MRTLTAARSLVGTDFSFCAHDRHAILEVVAYDADDNPCFNLYFAPDAAIASKVPKEEKFKDIAQFFVDSNDRNRAQQFLDNFNRQLARKRASHELTYNQCEYTEKELVALLSEYSLLTTGANMKKRRNDDALWRELAERVNSGRKPDTLKTMFGRRGKWEHWKRKYPSLKTQIEEVIGAKAKHLEQWMQCLLEDDLRDIESSLKPWGSVKARRGCLLVSCPWPVEVVNFLFGQSAEIEAALQSLKVQAMCRLDNEDLLHFVDDDKVVSETFEWAKEESSRIREDGEARDGCVHVATYIDMHVPEVEQQRQIITKLQLVVLLEASLKHSSIRSRFVETAPLIRSLMENFQGRLAEDNNDREDEAMEGEGQHDDEIEDDEYEDKECLDDKESANDDSGDDDCEDDDSEDDESEDDESEINEEDASFIDKDEEDEGEERDFTPGDEEDGSEDSSSDSTDSEAEDDEDEAGVDEAMTDEDDLEIVKEGRRQFAGELDGGRGARASRHPPSRFQDRQSEESDEDIGEPTDEYEWQAERNPEFRARKRQKKGPRQTKPKVTVDAATADELASSEEANFISKLEKWESMGLLRPWEGRKLPDRGPDEPPAKCIAAEHQVNFLKHDHERWQKTIEHLRHLSDTQGEEAAGRHWIKYGKRDGSDLKEWLPQKDDENGEIWTSRIFQMMFTGAGKSVVAFLTALNMAYRRSQLLKCMPANFDYEKGKTAVDREGINFAVGKIVFIGPLKATVDGLFNDLKPGLTKDDLMKSPLYKIMGWPLEEVRWLSLHTCRYAGLYKSNPEEHQKFAQNFILCSTNQLLTCPEHCKLLARYTGTIMWDEGDLGSGVKRNGVLTQWTAINGYKTFFKYFVNFSPQAAVYFYSSTKNNELRKMIEYKPYFVKYQQLQQNHFVKQITLRVIMSDPYNPEVAEAENRKQMRTVPGETRFWRDGSRAQIDESRANLKAATLWPYAQAIVKSILKRRHEERVPWQALIFVPRVGKDAREMNRLTDLLNFASAESDYDHEFAGEESEREQRGLPRRGECSIIRKRIKFKFTSATASDFTDEALEKFKSEDDSQCTGLLVKAQAGRSYDNPRIGICVDLTGHGYNAKIQGPIGRGMRVWRARIEDGASQVCASIAEKFRLLDNPNICEQQPDQTYTYQQKL